MKYCKITAIIQPAKLDVVEQKLKELCVPGISVTKVKGYGESPDFFHSDWTSAHARIEIFINADQAQTVVQGIMDAAHSGRAGDGMIAVLPVESLYRIRTREQVQE
ncbi:MAG: P-II family nitrogen regulator [Gammaproteobacteria bacterium]|nr:P-II family nitrogen regulator [Gammaproteobacteria bacterium]